ncbi:MAG: leucyl aminopeptidase family protein [Solirubrobacterales bacterium]|nr:leucyl aminopeptidase family protein [Solirubrobacterales bacterium]
MHIEATTQAPTDTGADTVAVPVFDGEGVAHDFEDGFLGSLVERGEAKTSIGSVAVTHGGDLRFIIYGLGKRDDLTPEKARRAAAAIETKARSLGCATLCIEIPHHADDATVEGLVEGMALSAHRWDTRKGDDPDRRDSAAEVLFSDHDDRAVPVARGILLAAAQNRARDLQNSPPNEMTPDALAARAAEIAATSEHATLETLDRAQLIAAGCGAFAAVAQGSDREPRMIVLKWNPPGVSAEPLALVGKAVTFDSGGISIKPSAGMEGMKFDMSGGATVLEATAAIIELNVQVPVISVVGATENLLSGSAMRPSDIVTASDGTTIEIDNTDAEGRLVLADCLVKAKAEGAKRIVDLATLTGAMDIALGPAYAGLFSNNDEWAATMMAASDSSGEPLWRMPLHPSYRKMIDGVYADIRNTASKRVAGASTAAEFLHHFVGDDIPWAHLDIAGVADDVDLPYAKKGGAGFGVRLLVTLAESLAA